METGRRGGDVRRASLSGGKEESRYSALEKEVEEAEKAELRLRESRARSAPSLNSQRFSCCVRLGHMLV